MEKKWLEYAQGHGNMKKAISHLIIMILLFLVIMYPDGI